MDGNNEVPAAGEFMNFLNNTNDDFLEDCFGDRVEQPFEANPPVQDNQLVQATPPVQAKQRSSKRTRGSTTSVDASCVISSGPKQITYTEVGYPIKDQKRQFSSWLGITVRNQVDITIMEWKDVDEKLKERIWKQTKVNYQISIQYTKKATYQNT